MSARLRSLPLLICACAAAAVIAPVMVRAGSSPSIDTTAGGPGWGPAGNVATRPCAVLASGGSVYVGDNYWHVVRRVDLSSGTTTVVAGDGQGGYYGDGGPATKAALYFPCGLALDGGGNLYIADSGNQRIRRVAPDRTISTIAGTGVDGDTGDGGPAVAAEIGGPSGLCIDSDGRLVVAAHNSSTVRAIDLSAGTIANVAGIANSPGFSGDGSPAAAAQLSFPQDVACASDGSLYIADSANVRVRRVAPQGLISTIAGSGTQGESGDGGPATQASMGYMYGIAVDAAGDVYVSDSAYNRVRLISNGVITTYAGDATQGYDGDGRAPAQTSLYDPAGLSLSGGTLFIADELDQRVRAASASTMSTVAGNGFLAYGGDGGPAAAAQLHGPVAVAFGADGSEYVADAFNDRVRRVGPDGVITTFAGNGRDPGSYPNDPIGDGGPATQAMLYSPEGVAVGRDGSVYISEMLGARVRRVAPDGTISTFAGNGTAGFSGDGGPATQATIEFPIGLALNPAGDLFIADSFNNRVRVVDHVTHDITTFAGGAPTPSQVNKALCSWDNGLSGSNVELVGPSMLVIDAAGDVYVSDYGNNRVRRLSPSAVVQTVAGTCTAGDTGDGGPATSAEMQGPTGLALDGAGDLLIADTGNDCIRMVDPQGTISVYAGACQPGFERSHGLYSGDEGPALAAQMSFPEGMAMDPSGNLVLTDYGNQRVRVVSAAPAADAPEVPATALLLLPAGLAAIITGRRRRHRMEA